MYGMERRRKSVVAALHGDAGSSSPLPDVSICSSWSPSVFSSLSLFPCAFRPGLIFFPSSPALVDQDKFGVKMLERMGWSSGDGLGKDRAGRTSNIVVRKKTSLTGETLALSNAHASRTVALE